MTCLPIGHKLVARWAKAPVAADGIFTFVLARVSALTFIDIWWGGQEDSMTRTLLWSPEGHPLGACSFPDQLELRAVGNYPGL